MSLILVLVFVGCALIVFQSALSSRYHTGNHALQYITFRIKHDQQVTVLLDGTLHVLDSHQVACETVEFYLENSRLTSEFTER